MPQLMITSGENRGQTFELKGTSIIGRHPQCEVVINDMHASRRHAKADIRGGTVYLSDLGSSNGTFVNGMPVVSEHPLKDGDEVCVSSTFFLFIDTPAEAGKEIKRATLGSFDKSAPASVPPAMRFGKVAKSGLIPASSGKVKVLDDKESGPIAFDKSLDAQQSLIMGLQPVGKAPTDQEAALKKATQRLEVLVELGTRLAKTTSIDDMLNKIMDRMLEIFPQADRGFIMLNTDDTVEGLDVRVMRNRDVAPGETPEFAVSKTVLRVALQDKKMILYSDAQGDNAALAGAVSLATLQIRSVMCVPLMLADELLGMIYIDTKDRMRAFVEDDMGLLAAVATQAAISIKNKQMAQEMIEEAEVRNNMARYLTPELVDKLVSGELNIEVGGERKVGTVFFSDLISFSKWSLQKSPKDVMDLLNRYFHVMEGVIFEHGGAIDKFMGDAIMATWGVLVPVRNAPLMATAAALDMQNYQYILCNVLKKSGDSMPGMGIGLNTGEFVAGNLGSDQKMEFTILGKHVNMGQRLESIAGFGNVYISDYTYLEIKRDAIALKLPDVSIKGWEKPVPAYSIRGVRLERIIEDKKVLSYILSLPLVSKLPDNWPATKPDYIGVITRAFPSKKQLAFEIWCFEPLKQGATVRIQPFLQEKKLPPIGGTVASCERFKHELLGAYYKMMLRVSTLPPQVGHVLRIGGCSPSDWKKQEEIIRA